MGHATSGHVAMTWRIHIGLREETTGIIRWSHDGKSLENHRKTTGKWWFSMGLWRGNIPYTPQWLLHVTKLKPWPSRKSWFTHKKWWIFPWTDVSLPEEKNHGVLWRWLQFPQIRAKGLRSTDLDTVHRGLMNSVGRCLTVYTVYMFWGLAPFRKLTWYYMKFV